MRKIKDTDFVHISTRIKAREQKLVNKSDIEKMLSAQNAQEVVQIMVEKGYDAFDANDPKSMENAFGAQMSQVREFLLPHIPQREIIDIFKIKADYHNIKTIIKADAGGVPCAPMLSQDGTVPPEQMCDIVRDRVSDGIDPVMAASIFESVDILARTADAQLCDICLDRAQYEQLHNMANGIGSPFLTGYIKLMTDGENLKAICRIMRMNKGTDFLGRVMHDGGNIPRTRLLDMPEPAHLPVLFGSVLSTAAGIAVEVVDGRKPFSELDRAVANALVEYVKNAKYIPFGEEVVLYYLLAKQGEQAQIRTIIVGKNMGQSKEKIAESLRQCYV